MMKITDDNYQAFLLDYIEGNLSKEDISILLNFLEKHPQYKEELSLYQELTLDKESESIGFDKSSLYQTDLQVDSVNENNLDDFAIAYTEELLGEEKKKEVLAFPKGKTAINSYKKTILKPENNIVYEDKQELKKSTRLIPIWFQYASGIAASILLVWFFYQVNLGGIDENNRNHLAVENIQVEKETNKASTLNLKDSTDYEEIHVAKTVQTLPVKKENSPKMVTEEKVLIKDLETQVLVTEKSLVAKIEPKEIKFEPNSSAENKTLAFVETYLDQQKIKTSNTDDHTYTPREYLVAKLKKNVLGNEENEKELTTADANVGLGMLTNQKVGISDDKRFILNGRNLKMNIKLR